MSRNGGGLVATVVYYIHQYAFTYDKFICPESADETGGQIRRDGDGLAFNQNQNRRFEATNSLRINISIIGQITSFYQL